MKTKLTVLTRDGVSTTYDLDTTPAMYYLRGELMISAVGTRLVLRDVIGFVIEERAR